MQQKKTLTPGNCTIMRCKAGVAVSSVNPLNMCDRHLDEWTNAGCPPLEAKAAPVKATSEELATVEAELISPVRTAASQYLQTISTIVLNTQEALDWIGAVREGMRQALGTVEARRTTITKPMNELKRAVDALFSPAKDSCEAVIKACDARMNAYHAEQRAAQDQALAMIQNGSRDDTTIAAAHLTGPSLPSTVIVRDEYDIQVTDFSLVPDMFVIKTLDTTAIETYARTRHGRVNIPGLTVTKRGEVRTAPGARG